MAPRSTSWPRHAGTGAARRATAFVALLAVLALAVPVSAAEPAGAFSTPLEVRWIHRMNLARDIDYMPVETAGVASDGLRAYAGSSRGIFYGFDLATGKVLWSFKASGAIGSTPAISGDRVVFGDTDGYVYCLRADDGGLWWRYQVRGEVLGQPAIAGGRVFVASSSNNVTALDLESGEWRWMFERPMPKGYSIRGVSSPVVEGANLYVGFSDGFFFALSADAGTELWKNNLHEEGRFRDIDATPLVVGDRIYVSGYDDGFYCLDRAKGTILWRREGGGVSRAAAAGSAVVVPGTDGNVYAVDAASGKEQWRLDVTETDLSRQIVKFMKRRRLATEAVAIGDRLIFGSERGFLYVVNQADGKILWRFTPGDGVAGTPIWVDGRLLFVGNGGNLYCLVPRHDRK